MTVNGSGRLHFVPTRVPPLGPFLKVNERELERIGLELFIAGIDAAKSKHFITAWDAPALAD